ncbi:MAG: ribosome maturation factor RimM [Rickettsiaceae bacterium]|nr:ribosome maturation factor RimM [Rickettsiaceae bacterium]
MNSEDLDKKDKNFIEIGRILGPTGIKGDLKLFIENDFCDYIVKNFNSIAFFSCAKTSYRFILKNVSGNIIKVSSADITDRNQAEKLGKFPLYCHRDELPPLELDEYYYSQIVGLKVLDLNHQDIGKIISINNYGAGDVVEINLKDNQLIILPFTKEIFLQVTTDFVIVNIPSLV